MTPEQEHEFRQAASLGVACGLQHRYEWYINADRALIHGPYSEMSARAAILVDAFIAFEKTTASCPEEQEELNKLTTKTYIKRVGDFYARARGEY